MTRMNRISADELAGCTAGAGEKPEPAAEKGIEAPFKLKVTAEKVQLKFTDAQLRSIFQALGKYAGINFLFDEQFRDVPLVHRPHGPDLRAGRELPLPGQQELLPADRREDGHHRPGPAHEEAPVRAQRRSRRSTFPTSTPRRSRTRWP